MPSIPTRTRIAILGGGGGALLLGALATRSAASTLVSPLTAVGMVPAMLAFFAAIAVVVVGVRGLPLPRLVRRLLAIGTMAASGWSIGTITRAVFVTLAFVFSGPVEEEVTVWQVYGSPTESSATQSFPVSSLEYRRTLSVPFDAGAVREIKPFQTCITLPLERTETGVTRVRLPDEALGVDDLEQCPAVQRLGN